MGVKTTNIPLAVANVLQSNNQSTQVVVREKRCEQIGTITLSNSLAVGSLLGIFRLAPAYMPGTRLVKLSQAFQEYRFTRANLKLQSTIATAVSGSITMGYSLNPDEEISNDAARQIFNWNGSQDGPVYTPISCSPQLEKRWLRNDLDSAEIMQTVQGYFALALSSTCTISSATEVSLYLDYEIEFRGATAKIVSYGNPSAVPAQTVTEDGGTLYSLATGGTPALSASSLYLISPPLFVNTGVREVILPFARAVTATQLQLYTSYQDAESVLAVNLIGNFSIYKTKFYPVTLN